MVKQYRVKFIWTIFVAAALIGVNFALGCPMTIDRMNQLIMLSGLEVILGFDNLVMVAIYVNQLPKHLQAKGRALGMAGALVSRVALLCGISFVMKLVQPLFHIGSHAFSGHDLVLITGGVFLVWKATKEIFAEVEGGEENHIKTIAVASLRNVIISIASVDIIFSLDSVVTAVGMAEDIPIMVLAVVISMAVMLKFAKVVGDFIEEHSSVKMLALAFLVLIGSVLIAEGFGKEIEKGYVYLPMAFAAVVNVLELRKRSKAGKRAALTRHEHELAAAQEHDQI